MSVEAISPRDRSVDPAMRRARRRLALLAGLAVLAVAAYLLIDVGGSWSFALRLRARTVLTMVVVGYAIALSTLLFQTVTTNRILTPSIMGFDSLYEVLQTLLLAGLGAATLATFGVGGRYALELGLMVAFSMLLFARLFGKRGYSLHLLVLVGIVLGVLFRSVSAFVQRLIDPNEFYVLQERLFAGFTRVDDTLLWISTGMIAVVSLAAWRIRHTFDVLQLGRATAVGLGVDHRRTVLVVLLLVAVLVSVSTALVGPILFFGLLVTNLAYQVVGTNRHAATVPAAVLLAIICLVGGQAVLQHGLGLDTTLSVVIEFLGGIVFLVLLVRSVRR
jgi:iron-siderophore transport system permease protein